MTVKKILFCTMIFTLSGCISNPSSIENTIHNNPFTHGNVQLMLKKGVTTQTKVLETFGVPNVATVDSEGNEVWTYQKNATVTTSRDNTTYATVILLGGRTSTSGFEQSSRTMTLILKFDATKKVIDFKSMTTSF